MCTIEEIEGDLQAHRRAVLMRLRKEDWSVVEVRDFTDIAGDQTWVIESDTRGKGIRLILWFYRYDGVHDGYNCVIASLPTEPEPGPWGGGDVSIQFAGRRFEKQLDEFMAGIDWARCSLK